MSLNLVPNLDEVKRISAREALRMPQLPPLRQTLATSGAAQEADAALKPRGKQADTKEESSDASAYYTTRRPLRWLNVLT